MSHGEMYTNGWMDDVPCLPDERMVDATGIIPPLVTKTTTSHTVSSATVMTVVDPKKSSTARINGTVRSRSRVGTRTNNTLWILQIGNLQVTARNQAIIKMITPTLVRVQEVMAGTVFLVVAATAITVEQALTTTMQTCPEVTRQMMTIQVGWGKRRPQLSIRKQQPGSLLPRRSARSFIVPRNNSTLHPIRTMMNLHPNKMRRQRW